MEDKKKNEQPVPVASSPKKLEPKDDQGKEVERVPTEKTDTIKGDETDKGDKGEKVVINKEESPAKKSPKKCCNMLLNRLPERVRVPVKDNSKCDLLMKHCRWCSLVNGTNPMNQPKRSRLLTKKWKPAGRVGNRPIDSLLRPYRHGQASTYSLEDDVDFYDESY